MALADSVPGVSGGTIAFLMGFYDKFIGSLNALISGTKAERIDALKYLVKLGIGWAVGFCSSVLVLANVFVPDLPGLFPVHRLYHLCDSGSCL